MQSSHIVIPSNIVPPRQTPVCILYLCSDNRDSAILVKSCVSASIGGLRNVVDRSSGSRVHGAFGVCADLGVVRRVHGIPYKCIIRRWVFARRDCVS